MEMNINVSAVVGWIVAISTIVTTGAVTYKAIISHFKKHMGEILTPVITPILGQIKAQQTDIEAAAERDALMMDAQLASLEAIHEGKNNGNITGAIGKLREYMLKQSSKPSSYAKE